MKIFEYDGGFIKHVILLSRLTLLNLIWIAACLPIITAGASTAAMYYSASCLMKGDIHVFKNFKSCLSLHWKRGTIIFLVFAFLSTLFSMACYLFKTANIPYHNALFVISCIAFLSLLFVVLWLFPVMLNFKGRLQELIFNAFIFSFMYAPITLLVIALYGITGYLFVRYFALRALIILFGPACITYCSLVLLEKVFVKYKTS